MQRQTLEDAVNHVGLRTWIAATFGLVAGSAKAVLQGERIKRTARLSALSCALTATACCGIERLAYHGIIALEGSDDEHVVDRNELSMMGRHYQQITSHAIGGTTGGSILGAMYIGSPVRGALFLGPLMMTIAVGEILLAELKEEREKELVELEDVKKQLNQQQQTRNGQQMH